jgi:hypothetical protein
MHARTRAIQVIVMWWLLFAGIVQATPILDQQHLPDFNGQSLTVTNDRTQIQTFTVGVTGVLTRIDVRVERSPGTVEDLDLSLWSADVAGLPKDLLATVSVPPSVIPDPGSAHLITVDLSAEAVAVLAGEVFAILLNSNEVNETYGWALSGQYDGGTAYTRLGPSLFVQSEDFHFSTYVDVENVNDLVTCEPLSSTFQFTPDPAGCPEGFVGKFSFEAQLTNSSEHSLTALVVGVTTLTNGNLLQNADGVPGGVGAQLTVPQQEGFSDGVLGPKEFVDVPFIICLQERQPFQFVVDVFGVVDADADAQVRAQLLK